MSSSCDVFTVCSRVSGCSFRSTRTFAPTTRQPCAACCASWRSSELHPDLKESSAHPDTLEEHLSLFQAARPELKVDDTPKSGGGHVKSASQSEPPALILS